MVNLVVLMVQLVMVYYILRHVKQECWVGGTRQYIPPQGTPPVPSDIMLHPKILLGPFWCHVGLLCNAPGHHATLWTSKLSHHSAWWPIGPYGGPELLLVDVQNANRQDRYIFNHVIVTKVTNVKVWSASSHVRGRPLITWGGGGCEEIHGIIFSVTFRFFLSFLLPFFLPLQPPSLDY